jgi:hypothetical protein
MEEFSKTVEFFPCLGMCGSNCCLVIRSALRTRRQKEPPASGPEGFPGNVTASVVGEVVDKDHVLQNQNIVKMPEGEGTTNVNKAGEEDQLNQQPRSEALESFRSKYKYTAGIPRHLLYKKSEVPNPAPVDEQVLFFELYKDVHLGTKKTTKIVFSVISLISVKGCITWDDLSGSFLDRNCWT